MVVVVAMVVEATEEVRVGSAAAAEGAKAEATVAGAMVWRRRCGGGGDAGEVRGLG